jgi:hypothetical protein
MKKWQKITLVSTGVLLMMGTLFAGSFAWFQDLNAANMNNGEGQTASAYFAGGDGSAASPYLIDKPVHLYNLAWLQYLGYFNKTDSNNNLQQKHFVLAKDLDMTGWVLPPIGTTDNPFMGTFSGDPGDGTTNYYVVKNLTVDNSIGTGHIERKPSAVSSVTGVNIVGMFGVVGNYDGKYVTASESNPDNLSIYDPSATANSIQNFYLDKATVKTQLPATLMGIAAGYVNAQVSGVGVSASSLNVVTGSHYYSSSLTKNISDYTTIGYCTENYKAKRDLYTTDVRAGQTGTAYYSSLQTGQNLGAGGSIGMNSIFTRLKSYFSDSSSSSNDINTANIVTAETVTVTNGTSTTSTTSTLGTNGYFKNYYDSSAPLKGSFSFNYLASGQGTQYSDSTYANFEFILLYGKREWTKKVTTNTVTTTGTLYSIAYGTRSFLAPSGTTAITNSTTASYSWTFSAFSGTGTISTKVNNTTYYLVANGTSGSQISLKLSTTASTNWTKTDGTHTTTTIGGTTYYLEYYGDWHIISTQYGESSLTYALPSTTTTTTKTGVLSAATKDTYFPINVENDNLPSITNTGYILSGPNYTQSTDGTYYRGGDIRVSRFQMGNLAYSLNGSYTNWYDCSATFNPASFDVLTQKDVTSGGSTSRVTYRIQDAAADNGNYADHTVNSNISGFTRVPYSGDSRLNLKKYKNSRAGLVKILKGTSTPASNDPIYGLHFMNSSISTSNLVEVPVAVVNREGVDANTKMADNTYYKYQMPRDSIDFNLQKKGYINFFAGTYFTGNNTFFSLHKINRTITDDANGVHASSAITSISEISKVYSCISDPTKDYQYSYYTDSTESTETLAAAPTDYQLVFDMKWVTAPTSIVENAAYYFEIPVDKGEYALGSVPGKNGAYLMYLDISANAQPISRTVITEYILTVNHRYEYPLGIALVNDPSASKDTIDALNSVAASLKNNTYNGIFTIAKDANNVTFTTDNVNFSPGYQGDNLILLGKKTDGTSFTPPALADIEAERTTSYIKRMTYIDRNLAEPGTTTTVITYNSAGGAMSFSYTDTNGTTSTPTTIVTNTGDLADASTFSETSIDVSSLATTEASYWYSYFAAKTNVTAAYAFTYTLVDGTVDGQAGKIASITGYTITLTSTGDTLTINVDTLANTYTVTLNGTTVATGPIPTA